MLQLAGFSRGAESMQRARQRAKECAEQLGCLAVDGGAVLFVGHFFLNWLIGRELAAMGWKGRNVLNQKY